MRTSWRNFLKTKRVFFPALAAVAGLLGYSIYQGMQFVLHRDVLWFAGELQQACAPLFLLELCLSYEFLHTVRHSGLEETVSAIPGGKLRHYAAPLGVLLSLTALLFLVEEAALRAFGDSCLRAWNVLFPHPGRQRAEYPGGRGFGSADRRPAGPVQQAAARLWADGPAGILDAPRFGLGAGHPQ